MNSKLILIGGALVAFTASAADIYVSFETGKNKNAGTKEAPQEPLEGA